MNYFRENEIFASLSEEDGELLSSFCQMQTLQSGEYLFRQDEEAQAMYMIISGEF
jgi:CRP-like cAMP-binding protein